MKKIKNLSLNTKIIASLLILTFLVWMIINLIPVLWTSSTFKLSIAQTSLISVKANIMLIFETWFVLILFIPTLVFILINVFTGKFSKTMNTLMIITLIILMISFIFFTLINNESWVLENYYE